MEKVACNIQCQDTGRGAEDEETDHTDQPYTAATLPATTFSPLRPAIAPAISPAPTTTWTKLCRGLISTNSRDEPWDAAKPDNPVRAKPTRRQICGQIAHVEVISNVIAALIRCRCPGGLVAKI